MNGRRAVLRAAAALAVGAALAGAGCDRAGLSGGSAAASFNAVDITGAEYARTLSLPDADGRLRSLDEFRGRVTVVFFGFTQCPDVCPTTLAELAQIRQALGADGARLQTVFVTLDPERDTPALLKAYVANFGPDVVALRGTPDQTRDVAKHFKIFFAKVAGKTEGQYGVDHTAGAYVFDAAGRVRLFTRYGMPAEQLKADLAALLKEAPPG